MKNVEKFLYHIIWLSVTVLLLLWLILFPPFQASLFETVGNCLGIAGYIFFSLSLFLGSRLPKLEDWIGGLDQIYHLHHRLGIVGFILLIIHPLALSLKWLPQHIDKFITFTLPIHHRLSINLGSIAFWIMVVVISITLLRLLSYDKWKILHGFMSLAYLLGSFHFILSSQPHHLLNYSQNVFYPFFSLGLFGIFYKQLYLPFAKRIPYTITEVEELNDRVIKITAQTKSDPLIYFPGQYAFFRFHDPKLTTEEHPFTLCPENKHTFSILVKVRGDFTENLYKKIAPGSRIELQGPCGRFDYKKGEKSQIWIAGGIGVVPFLIWARELTKNQQRTIDFFLCVHRKKDKILFDEFHKISKTLPQFRCHLFCSEENKRLAIKQVLDLVDNPLKRQILMCGPKRLTKDFTKKFCSIGIKRKNIFFEDFEFF